MDSRDKQFDLWMKDKLNADIPLSKQNRQAAWEQIRMVASQPTMTTALAEDDFVLISSPVTICEPLHTRMWRFFTYLFTQETMLQKAHENSVQHYKATPNYSGGLNLHSIELMRHRWTCAVYKRTKVPAKS